MRKTAILPFLSLLICAASLSGCALCHGFDNHHGGEAQGSYWDRSNMDWSVQWAD